MNFLKLMFPELLSGKKVLGFHLRKVRRYSVLTLPCDTLRGLQKEIMKDGVRKRGFHNAELISLY